MSSLAERLVPWVRDYYHIPGAIPLHAPVFGGNEKKYLNDTIDSTFVSSVGAYVNQFEQCVAEYTDSPRAVATVNGTAALHLALKLAGVEVGDLVITQPLTFIATCNAIHYLGAEPVFVDIDSATLGLSPQAVAAWLDDVAYIDDHAVCRHTATGKRIRVCLPMHTFGHPADLDGLAQVCKKWHLILVEDAAESLGSFYHGKHTGTIGQIGCLSFNGNKIITTGGGGMVLANEEMGQRAKHLSTTAKVAHPYEYIHDEIGYNYRLPNLNAALGCAQMEQLEDFIVHKRHLAGLYQDFFAGSDYLFIAEPPECRSNYWLNAIICPDLSSRNQLLHETNQQGVMTRPVWQLMHLLPMHAACHCGPLPIATWMADRLVNLPSGVRLGNEKKGTSNA